MEQGFALLLTQRSRSVNLREQVRPRSADYSVQTRIDFLQSRPMLHDPLQDRLNL